VRLREGGEIKDITPAALIERIKEDNKFRR